MLYKLFWISLALLEFLRNNGKLNRSLHKNCNVYHLEFNYHLFTIEVLFLFPYENTLTSNRKRKESNNINNVN